MWVVLGAPQGKPQTTTFSYKYTAFVYFQLRLHSKCHSSVPGMVKGCMLTAGDALSFILFFSALLVRYFGIINLIQRFLYNNYYSLDTQELSNFLTSKSSDSCVDNYFLLSRSKCIHSLDCSPLEKNQCF